MTRHNRRTFLVTTGATLYGAFAGCIGNSREPGEQRPGQPLDPPVLGDNEAPVTVEVFEDFGCPGCAAFHDSVFPEMREDFVEPGEVQVQFHDLVGPVHGASWEAASAARSVQDQAEDDAFWTFLIRVLENQEEIGANLFKEIAADVNAGLDPERVRQDGTEEAYDETVTHYADRAESLGLTRTPSVIVDGRELDWESIEYPPIEEAIQRELS